MKTIFLEIQVMLVVSKSHAAKLFCTSTKPAVPPHLLRRELTYAVQTCASQGCQGVHKIGQIRYMSIAHTSGKTKLSHIILESQPCNILLFRKHQALLNSKLFLKIQHRTMLLTFILYSHQKLTILKKFWNRVEYKMMAVKFE